MEMEIGEDNQFQWFLFLNMFNTFSEENNPGAVMLTMNTWQEPPGLRTFSDGRDIDLRREVVAVICANGRQHT
jgi:hypothetical protein